ncbi:terminase small subunit [Chloroflexota bacterium]
MSKRGNPAWYRGMPSANPKGRPRGQTSLAAYQSHNLIHRFMRWDRFCWALTEPPFTGAAAARKAGYSLKSARFIASRLIRKPVVRYILKEHRAMVELYCSTNNMKYSITGDVIEKLKALNKLREEKRIKGEPMRVGDLLIFMQDHQI